MDDTHPDWTQEERNRIAKGQVWIGMTIDQYECYLGRLVENQPGYQVGFIPALLGMSHQHITPDIVKQYSDGAEWRYYVLAESSSSRYSKTARFRGGRFVDSSNTMIR